MLRGWTAFSQSPRELHRAGVFAALDAIGLPEWRQLPAVRTTGGKLNASSSWVAAPRDVRPPAAAPARTGTPVAGPVGYTQFSTRRDASPHRWVPPASLPIVTPEAAPATDGSETSERAPADGSGQPAAARRIRREADAGWDRAPAVGDRASAIAQLTPQLMRRWLPSLAWLARGGNAEPASPAEAAAESTPQRSAVSWPPRISGGCLVGDEPKPGHCGGSRPRRPFPSSACATCCPRQRVR